MTDQEVVQVLTVLRDLFNSVKPYSENMVYGSTHCIYCGTDQGEWAVKDPNWVPIHTERCIIGRARAVLRKYPGREDDKEVRS